MTTLQPRPAVNAPGQWSFPGHDEYTLGNGLRVLQFRLPGQHVVSAALSFDRPLSAEPRQVEGVAGLVARLLDQGTRSHPGTLFADAVEGCGAEMDAAAGFSSTEVSLDVPASRLSEALPLLAEAVREPELGDADTDRERAVRLAGIEQQRANPASRADIALREAMLDPSVRASRIAGGEAGTVRAVTGQAVRDFHAHNYGPGGTTLVLAGDIADQRGLVERAFGEWTEGRPASVPHETPRYRGRRLLLVDRPGSVQAEIRMAHPSIDRTDARWADLQVALNALGGAFMSRLNSVLREEKGFTYGVHAFNSAMRTGGWAVVQGSFRNEVVAETVELIPQLVDVSARPITPDEIVRATTYLAGVQPLQYATASGVCSGVLTLLGAGLEPEFLDALRAAYARVTPESATAIAAELLPPDALSLVLVGDAEQLEGGLRERGVDVTVVTDSDGA